jgi:ribokinase
MTAAGVKATLKSLRTRVGLRPDRITSTSLELDTLERLASVRYLQDQGLDRATAIVEAVCEAAAALPVTESLIVDAALSLQLNAEAAGEADLYAEDLADRRVALIREWDGLHAAHGALAPPAPTVRSLRLDLEDAALGQLASVLVGEKLERRRPPMATPDHERLAEGERAALVIGAAAYDYSFNLKDMPTRNTSVQAGAFAERPGGKGLNQAIGLARLGAKVRLISALGSDEPGKEILEFLRTERVDTDYLETRPDSKSPRTVVFALEDGSYSYTAWKNQHQILIRDTFLRGPEFQSVIETASVVLLTLEPPRDTVATVLDVISRSKRCPLIVTASPPIDGRRLSGKELRLIDYLIANEWELRCMVEDPGGTLSVQGIVDRLLLAGVRTICVTGPNQCRIYGVPDDFVQPPHATVVMADQSASKDAFAAALASRIAASQTAKQQDFHYAYHAMLVAGQSYGTSSSLPTRGEIADFEELFDERARSVGGGTQ